MMVIIIIIIIIRYKPYNRSIYPYLQTVQSVSELHDQERYQINVKF